MKNATIWITIVLSAAGLRTVQGDSDSAAPAIDVQRVKPRWQVGDVWVVETRTLLSQRRQDAQSLARPVPWQFRIRAREPFHRRETFILDIHCLLADRPQPKTTLWVDARTMTLKQVQTEFPVWGGFRQVTEHYAAPHGQAAPVLGLLTALPIDLPLFLGTVKGSQTFEYVAYDGPIGSKAVEDIGFQFTVSQAMQTAKAEESQALINAAFAKGLLEAPAVEVRLKSVQRDVRQLWREDLPWPVYSRNRTTEMRLIRTLPAKRD